MTRWTAVRFSTGVPPGVEASRSTLIRCRFEPVGVGLPAGDLGLDLRVAQDDATAGIDHDHLAGTEPALLDDGRLVDCDRAGLGSRDQQAIGRDRVAQRPQAVAVKRGTGNHAIAEGKRGRSVPLLIRPAW